MKILVVVLPAAVALRVVQYHATRQT